MPGQHFEHKAAHQCGKSDIMPIFLSEGQEDGHDEWNKSEFEKLLLNIHEIMAGESVICFDYPSTDESRENCIRDVKMAKNTKGFSAILMN